MLQVPLFSKFELQIHTQFFFVEIDQVLQAGKKNRSVGATLMNATSSRSHSIFTVVVECSEGDKIRVGKLNLVDLAGSERQSKVSVSNTYT